MALSDGELIARVLGGDSEGYALLFQRYARLVHAVALARTTRRDAAAQITRQVFEKAYAGLESLPDGVKFHQHLVHLATEAARDHVREHGRSLQMFRVSPEDARKGGAVDFRAVLGGMHPDDAALVVLEMLARLPPNYEVPLLLRLVEGMSHAEIAEQTGRPPAELRTTLDSGRRLLEREFRMALEKAGQP